MKRYLPTILMTVVLVGLAGYVYFIEGPSEQRKTETESREKKLLAIDERDITGLTLQSGPGTIVLDKKDGRWTMTAPVHAEADKREVDALVRALVIGKVSRVVDESAAALEPFGLAQPPVTIAVRAGTQEESIAIGDSGPISSTLYAMRGSDKKVLLTDLAAKDVLNKTVLTFRKKEVLALDQGKIDRVRLTTPKTEIVLYRLDETGGRHKWTIRYPIETGADQPEVRSLLIKAEDLKALGFIDAGPDREIMLKRLAQPDVKLTLHADGADQTVKLYRGDAAGGEAFAVTTPDAPIYRINPSAIDDFSKELFALQDKRLLGLDREQIALLSVKTRDTQYTLINQNDEWVLEDRPSDKLDQQKTALLVSRVVELPAELRVVKQAGPLAPYGLATPTLEVTATARDGKATGRLILGTKIGGLVYAMGQRLPGVYQARADLLTQVPAKDELLIPAAPK